MDLGDTFIGTIHISSTVIPKSPFFVSGVLQSAFLSLVRNEADRTLESSIDRAVRLERVRAQREMDRVLAEQRAKATQSDDSVQNSYATCQILYTKC